MANTTDSYIAFIDHRFLREAVGELRDALGNHCEVRAMLEEQALLVGVQGERHPAAQRHGSPTFVDSLLSINVALPFHGDYLIAVNPLLSLIGRRRFALEVKKLGLHAEETAKSIEVRLGTALEALGAAADLSNPELKIYVILTGTEMLLCTDETGGKRAVDGFRAMARSRYAPLNRSELKLMEAVELFDLDMSAVHRCLDMGAAPGGWSNYMLKRGITVVAVDAASMDHSRLESGHTIVVTDRPMVQAAAPSQPRGAIRSMTFGEAAAPGAIESALAGPERCSLLHLMCKVQAAEARLLPRLGPFDAILCDMNCAPEEAARGLTPISHLLRPGGFALMTAKLFNGEARAHAASSIRILGTDFTSFVTKKLPHDRKELTILAFKK